MMTNDNKTSVKETTYFDNKGYFSLYTTESVETETCSNLNDVSF